MNDSYYALGGGQNPTLAKSKDLKNWGFPGELLHPDIPKDVDVAKGEVPSPERVVAVQRSTFNVQRSTFNAATECMKGTNPNVVMNRTQALHGLFDGLVGLS